MTLKEKFRPSDKKETHYGEGFRNAGTFSNKHEINKLLPTNSKELKALRVQVGRVFAIVGPDTCYLPCLKERTKGLPW